MLWGLYVHKYKVSAAHRSGLVMSQLLIRTSDWHQTKQQVMKASWSIWVQTTQTFLHSWSSFLLQFWKQQWIALSHCNFSTHSGPRCLKRVKLFWPVKGPQVVASRLKNEFLIFLFFKSEIIYVKTERLFLNSGNIKVYTMLVYLFLF